MLIFCECFSLQALPLIALYPIFITETQAPLWARTPPLLVFIFLRLFLSFSFFFLVSGSEAAENHPQRLEDHCICS